MEMEHVVSAEDRNMIIGFANNILPLAFEEVQQGILKNKNAVIQKAYMGEDGSTGMVNIRVKANKNFTLDIFVSNNHVHGKSFHLQSWKEGQTICSFLSDLSESGFRSMDGDTIEQFVAFLGFFQDTVQEGKYKAEADRLLEQVAKKHREELIDRYLASGEFEKIRELQNAEKRLFV